MTRFPRIYDEEETEGRKERFLGRGHPDRGRRLHTKILKSSLNVYPFKKFKKFFLKTHIFKNILSFYAFGRIK